MDYQATVRYGERRQRYLTFVVTAPDVASALRMAAESIPEDVIPEADLVELRYAPDFDENN
jgi:hypothetical protein